MSAVRLRRRIVACVCRRQARRVLYDALRCSRTFVSRCVFSCRARASPPLQFCPWRSASAPTARLLLRSFSRLQQVDVGFRPTNILTFDFDHDGAQVQRRRRHPGNLPSALGTAGPVARRAGVRRDYGAALEPDDGTVEGRAALPGERFINADQRTAAGRYFEAMGIPLIAGRLFTAADTRSSPRVIIVDESMARSLWPGEDAIGKRIRTGGIDASTSAPWLTVVGDVRAVKQDALDTESRIAFLLPRLPGAS
jgi:hypothetical protein